MNERITAAEMRLFTLNISGPSVERADRMLRYIERLDADVLVMTETRDRPGTDHLMSELRARGYVVVAPACASRGERGVAVACRVPVLNVIATCGVELSHRVVAVELDVGDRLTILGVYVPSRDASPAKVVRKRQFLEQYLRLLEELAEGGSLVTLGDLNVIARSHWPRYSSFKPWEYESLESIDSIGLVDAFSALHPGVQVHSWIGRTGNGYRYDYSFVSPDLLPRVAECNYDDAPRTLALSDHAGLAMTIRTQPALLKSTTDTVDLVLA